MKTTWSIGCVCKRREALSLAVLINRGLDLYADKEEQTAMRPASAQTLWDADFVFFVQFSGHGPVRYAGEPAESEKQLASMAVRVHPFPSRTRQLSSLAPTILGW